MVGCFGAGCSNIARKLFYASGGEGAVLTFAMRELAN
jgi:hypothetical protein